VTPRPTPRCTGTFSSIAGTGRSRVDRWLSPDKDTVTQPADWSGSFSNLIEALTNGRIALRRYDTCHGFAECEY
jgi:hypothetical protein